MTVNELIEELQMLADETGGDQPVEIVFQPNFPLLAKIKRTSERGGISYLVADEAHGYAPSDI